MILTREEKILKKMRKVENNNGAVCIALQERYLGHDGGYDIRIGELNHMYRNVKRGISGRREIFNEKIGTWPQTQT